MITKLRVLTFNVWGVPFFSADRIARIEAIGDKLATLQLDIVGIQELWVASDIERLIQRIGLPYHHYFHTGVYGSGLIVFSRYPIVDANLYRFRLSARPHKLPRELEYYGGKAVGFVRLQTPVGLVDVYNVHTIAQYQPDNSDFYKAHRAASAYECARYVATQSPAVYPVLLMGDLNMRPDQFGYDLILSLANLIDTHEYVHPNTPGYTIPIDTAYTSKRGDKNKRIDYIMARSSTTLELKPISSELLFQESDPLPTIKAYSDHYAVLVEFEAKPQAATVVESPDQETVKQIYQTLASLLEAALHEAKARHKNHILQTVLASLLVLVLNILVRTKFAKLNSLDYPLPAWLASFYAILQGWLSVLILPEEVQAFQSLSNEVNLQVKAKRAFNGLEWD